MSGIIGFLQHNDISLWGGCCSLHQPSGLSVNATRQLSMNNISSKRVRDAHTKQWCVKKQSGQYACKQIHKYNNFNSVLFVGLVTIFVDTVKDKTGDI